MTKEEFLKKALGSQYSEKEAEKGLLDLDGLMRTAKNNLGSQFTEKEFNTIMGVETPTGVMDLVDQNKLRILKEQMGGQFTEKEAMNIMNKGGTVVDPNGGYGGSPYQNTGNQTMIPFKTDAFGLPIPEVDVATLQRQFSDILSSITPREQENVLKHWQMSDDNGKIQFMQYIVNNPAMATGYGVQDEVLLPRSQQNLGL
jgi:hypothetical protein